MPTGRVTPLNLLCTRHGCRCILWTVRASWTVLWDQILLLFHHPNEAQHKSVVYPKLYDMWDSGPHSCRWALVPRLAEAQDHRWE